MTEDNKSIITVEVEKPNIWKEEQEKILKTWADKSQCFKVMHEKAAKKYWCLNAWITIPVIILSTVTGTGNFAQGSFPQEYVGILVVTIGSFNLFSAIMSTISNFIGIGQALEGHKFAAISWDKFSRKIQVELSKPREDRVNAKDFVKICQEDYDRLIEISPDLPDDIIRWFNDVLKYGTIEVDQCGGNCGLICYNCILFPCGCKGCKKRRNKSKIVKDKVIADWKELEIPEVLGRFYPTKIVTKVSVPVETEEIEEEKEDIDYRIYKV
jgi:hypothetical protein